jgi:hypothetical protein
MVSDALALARSQAEATFQIGGYEFRSPDYRQILLWAEALKIAPTTVVQRLEGASLKLDQAKEGQYRSRLIMARSYPQYGT